MLEGGFKFPWHTTPAQQILVMASFGWSAGDLALAIKIIYEVGNALKDTGGASSDYQETVAFLQFLATTLDRLHAYVFANSDNATSICLFVIILHSAAGGHGISRTHFPPRFFRNIKKQKQSRESFSPQNKRKPPRKYNINFSTPPSLDSS